MTEQAQTLTEWRCPACGGATCDFRIGEPVMRQEPMPGRPDLKIDVYTGVVKYTHYRMCQTPNCRLNSKRQKYPMVAIEVES